jgi:hypothetical protein
MTVKTPLKSDIYLPIQASRGIPRISSHFEVVKDDGDLLVGRGVKRVRAVGVRGIIGRVAR